MQGTVIETPPLYEQVKLVKDKEERSNRWLIDKLKNYGLNVTDAQMSNKLKGVQNFTAEEILACAEIFKTKFKA